MKYLFSILFLLLIANTIAVVPYFMGASNLAELQEEEHHENEQEGKSAAFLYRSEHQEHFTVELALKPKDKRFLSFLNTYFPHHISEIQSPPPNC